MTNAFFTLYFAKASPFNCIRCSKANIAGVAMAVSPYNISVGGCNAANEQILGHSCLYFVISMMNGGLRRNQHEVLYDF